MALGPRGQRAGPNAWGTMSERLEKRGGLGKLVENQRKRNGLEELERPAVKSIAHFVRSCTWLSSQVRGSGD